MMKAEHWIDVITLIGAAAAFFTGLYQYRRAQKWKVAEFVANEIKAFEADPAVRDVLLMIDWDPIQLCLESIDGRGQSYWITHKSIRLALRPHDQVPEGFEPPLSQIRQKFDVFFSKLGRFNHYIKTGLIKRTDLDPYLDYWMDELSGRAKLSKGTSEAVRMFLVRYHYRDVSDLLDLYAERHQQEVKAGAEQAEDSA